MPCIPKILRLAENFFTIRHDHPGAKFLLFTPNPNIMKTTNKYQIMRMLSGKQQTYDTAAGTWKTSNDRWDHVFEATPEQAREIHSKVMANFRRVGSVTTPKLHVID